MIEPDELTKESVKNMEEGLRTNIKATRELLENSDRLIRRIELIDKKLEQQFLTKKKPVLPQVIGATLIVAFLIVAFLIWIFN
jgi:hypothetical protein